MEWVNEMQIKQASQGCVAVNHLPLLGQCMLEEMPRCVSNGGALALSLPDV